MQQQPPLPLLFNFSHVAAKSLRDYLLLLCYLPIGLTLLTVRLAHKPDSRSLLWSVRTKGEPVSSQSPLIISSNHITAFDGIPFLLARPMHILVDKTFFESSTLAKRFFNIVHALPIDRSHTDPAKRAAVRADIAAQLTSTKWPLLFYPEGWDTNGRVGVLLYQKFLFSLGIPIQPAALRVSVPFLPLVPSKLGTSVFNEVLWLFFSPCWYYEITYLPVQTNTEGDDEIAFASRVQRLSALALKLIPTNYSYKDALVLRSSLRSGTPLTKRD